VRGDNGDRAVILAVDPPRGIPNPWNERSSERSLRGLKSAARRYLTSFERVAKQVRMRVVINVRSGCLLRNARGTERTESPPLIVAAGCCRTLISQDADRCTIGRPIRRARALAAMTRGRDRWILLASSARSRPGHEDTISYERLREHRACD